MSKVRFEFEGCEATTLSELCLFDVLRETWLVKDRALDEAKDVAAKLWSLL